ncbi:DNA polymerase IV (DinB-like DNA polymerase) [Methanomicrobium sp. W14]|uniref:DNA polymerase IV n=1 Tax=Methanomicrobium sp. W14 TaxID=2817839 RepID=UPI001AE6A54E|nr:DNA polymerase IV [Methanomicrobium sp. W14]MBP2133879.1 DNA polymerase IV (DinB-like DNA polymerase) [Methanomicrobium sp. W14]
MTETAEDRIILHIDMDCFYASVEVRENQKLRGLPVIIGADPKGGDGRGVVSTCSYEARDYGVHSAMPISTAYRMCPKGIFLPVNFSLYKKVSESVMEILRKYSDKFEQVSIDEAYLDLSCKGSFSDAEKTAKEIKERIFQKERITCSAGIGPSKVVAKIASDFQKPDGVTVVRPEEVTSFLNPMPIGKIPGIGKKTSKILSGAGISTVRDLLDYDIQKLISLLGRHAADLKEIASGNDTRDVRKRESRKSIGKEKTYSSDTKDKDLILKTAEQICSEVKKAVSSRKIRFRTVTVKIRYAGFITNTRSKTLVRHTFDSSVIDENAKELISKYLDTTKPVRLIGVSVSGFDSPKSIQTTMSEYM